ncbi:MAG: GNAT family N-acetyltransferase [Weeksellaceae bacterium]|nr:GNAT family N-acetyltransferase [Weeksellaceae bacterium]
MKKLISLSLDKIPLVQQLAREIWEEHYTCIIGQSQIDYMLNLFYSTQQIQSEIEKGVFWEILYWNDEAVGYLVCELQDEKLHLSKIYLKSKVQGKGLGKFLIQRAIEIAKLHQKKSIVLNVNKNNVNSILFYEKNAFIKIDEGIFDIGNGFVMDDFIYERNV